MTPMSRTFPPGFLFGAATAAFQIEGAAHEDGRRDSVWDAFCRVPGAIVNGDDGAVACDHYHRYRDDVALMRELGLQTYRFSTSWARVRPDGGPLNRRGLDFYERLVDELLASGIRPWLTLYHWDLPQALQERGGWTVRETADRFTEYALDVHDALGDRITAWTTLNEPWCAAFLGYTAGAHAPGRRSPAEGMLAAHHLLLGHGQTVRALRERDPLLELGITLNLTVADPVDAADPADTDAARRIDGQFNRWFLDPVFLGSYPADVLDDFRETDAEAVALLEDAVRDGDLETIAAPLDALGVNYYHGDFVGGRPSPVPTPDTDAPTLRAIASPFPAHRGIFWHERGLPRTSQGWEVQPEGLTRVLRRVAAEYTGDLPLYVTENGAAYDDVPVPVEGGRLRIPDADRAAFLEAHLGAILDAIEAGVDVRGYFAWSLLDNFEWAWGYDKRFGIIHVDFATQRRSMKDSAIGYSRIIAERAVPESAPVSS
jgi:beta-glucosidase